MGSSSIAVLWLEPKDETLQSASGANGDGTVFVLDGKYGSLTVQVVGDGWTGTINFEASQDRTNYVAIEGANKNTGAKVTTATADGLFVFDVMGVKRFKARQSGFSAGTVTVTATATAMPPNGAQSDTDVNVTGSSLTSNPSATQTRPNNTTAYTAGDVVGEDPAENMTFTTTLAAASGFIVVGGSLEIDVAAIPSGMAGFRLHLYDAAPTGIADNTAYNLPSGDRAKYLGYVTFLTPVDLGATLWAMDDGARLSGKLAAASQALYGILETLGAYTPTASTVKSVELLLAAV